MPTSNSYSYTTTRDQIISAAFRKIGVLGDYESIDSQRLNAGISALNPMIKAYHSQGMPLWTITEQIIPMSFWTTAVSVSIGPGQAVNQSFAPLKIIQAFRRDDITPTAPTDVDLLIETRQNYSTRSNKLSRGTPTSLSYLPFAGTGALFLWPLPDLYWQTNGKLYLRFQRPFQDFVNSTDEPDFPVEWHEALIYNLAVRLASEYGVSPTDRGILKSEAKEALENALSFGTEEGSLFIQPARK
jgi:hypothetical protein